MTLIWQKTTFAIFGEGYELAGLPNKNDCAHARKSDGRFVALATINGRFLCHTARTMRSAMNRLEREIDKRSIGLLGVDDVTFEVTP